MRHLRTWVFGPVFILLIATVSLNLWNETWFSLVITHANQWILHHFNGFFAIATLVMFLTCLGIFFSKLGSVKIGGEGATPLLNRWQWFSITLCTTIATGILFWGTAEPIYHLGTPTHSLGIAPGSKEAAEFAISTLFFHWSFIPYAIYSVPVVAFAIAFYNRQQPYSLASSLLFDVDRTYFKFSSHLIDVICLFALVLGMSASLGGGILTISGGLKEVFGFQDREFNRILVAILIILAFTISASTGLLKGIRFLSIVNMYFFIFLASFFAFFIVDREWLRLIFAGLGDFAAGFFHKGLFTLLHPADDWGNSWTIFNWANWLAWAPVTALFLARISVGYTVRQVLLFNWILPSIFSIIWMSIFGGASVMKHLNGSANMLAKLETSGPESLIYAILSGLPLFSVLSVLFIATVFLSFVTAADSNTEAMSSLSTKGVGTEAVSSPVWIKILWGALIGITAYLMISFAGIEGMKILSTLGGFPSLLLLIVVNVGLIRYWWIR